jgi:hypothetical protein
MRTVVIAGQAPFDGSGQLVGGIDEVIAKAKTIQ